MIDCPIYMITSGEEPAPSPVEDDVTCSGCGCGYVQYESLMPYLLEIRDSLHLTNDVSVDFEFKLREQIAEISRLFDMAAGVIPGHFSQAHYTTTKIITSGQTRYLKIPEFVPGTLEIRTMDDVLVDPSLYLYMDGHAVYKPCTVHSDCSCNDTCGGPASRKTESWPLTCYKVRAKWGKQCADLAVQKAIRDYLIETYRMQDPVIQLANGISIQRKFMVPHSWDLFIKNYKDKKKIFSNFAIA